MTPQEQLNQIKGTLERAALAKERARQEADRNAVFAQIGQYISAALRPLMDAVSEMKRMAASNERMASNLSSMQMPEPKVNIDLSSLRIPEPRVMLTPHFNVPDVKMPSEMNIKGWVGLMGYDRGLLSNPLPVQLRDADGKPVKLFENLTQIIGGGGGGGFKHVVVDNLADINISAASATSVTLVNADGTKYNSDNPLPVTFSAATQQVQQVSGAIDSVNLIQVGGNAVVTGTGYQDNALRVVQATDATSSVSIVSNIAALDIKQVSGSIDSVNITHFNGSLAVTGTGYQDNAIRVVNATDAITSVYVTGSSGTTAIVGDVSPGSANVNSPPVRIGGVSTQTNPAIVTDGNVINFRADDLGRQIIRPIQVRDLLATAYASIATGTETTLATAAAGTYLDLIYMMGTNNSDAAVTVDIRAVSAGNIMTSIRIPANGTAGVSLPAPIPQDATGNAWTADLPDITGTTVTLSALFSKEV